MRTYKLDNYALIQAVKRANERDAEAAEVVKTPRRYYVGALVWWLLLVVPIVAVWYIPW